jgi:hypothetical protein
MDSVTQTIMYVIYTDPVQRTNDFDEACFIADDYFNATGHIVAVEEDDNNA